MKKLCMVFLFLPGLLLGQEKAGEDAESIYSYDQFEQPTACKTCHIDLYQQWDQAMMSRAYTHHWDEIEYFKLAVPHAEKDEKVAGVKAGCNGCHSPIAFMAGDVPPPKPEENSRANQIRTEEGQRISLPHHQIQ
ncbi:MAG: hypothetical protein MAGBODY4_00283 [Candidatus Marinimicrobia bacterium]|nr:hypothetical protein [Candidatus Neomarinimicrobiota bacterium]